MVVDLTAKPFVKGSTVEYVTQILDESGAGVPAAQVTSLTLTLTSPYTGQVVNGVDHVNVKNVDRGTIDASGNVVIKLTSTDTATKFTSLAVERLRLTLVWIYGTSEGVWPVDIGIADA